MKISTNSIRGLKKYFHEKLDSIYQVDEIHALFLASLQEVFSISRIDYSLKKEELKFSESELLTWMRFTKKLATQVPFQHLSGKQEFMGLDFMVNEHVLIPRPETEELVSKIQAEYAASDALKILEVGVGSGCISLSLAAHFKRAEITAIDISEKALEVARQNANYLNLKEVNFIKQDVFEFTPPENIDILISNPPYVLPEEKLQMHNRVIEFEPHLALFVDEKKPINFYAHMLSWKKQCKTIYFEGNPLTLPKVLIDGAKKGWTAGELFRDLNNRIRFAKFTQHES